MQTVNIKEMGKLELYTLLDTCWRELFAAREAMQVATSNMTEIRNRINDLNKEEAEKVSEPVKVTEAEPTTAD